MIHSSDACRAQAALQEERAANAGLENVRRIAAKAVIAWNKEADLAEARERRRRVASGPGTLSSEMGALSELPANCREPDADELVDQDLLLGTSENPDRGLSLD